VIAAAHSFVSHVIDAPMVESYALKKGLLLAQHIGGNRLIIQSDCMEVVETMKDGVFSANSATAIYDECIIIWSGFQEISIEHCKSDANCVAHELARRAKQTNKDCIWDDEPSSFINEFVKRCNYLQLIKLAYALLKKLLFIKLKIQLENNLRDEFF
jgi:hypothetical protein